MTTTWHGCYDDNWNGQIVPEAFSHPAKMANGLVNRIFDYAIAKGWIVPGESVVVDPFGGIGSTGIIGASRGVQVLCCELEQKFVDLAKQNFELHRRTWEACCDPLPVIVQGDSRRLCEVLGPALADCICSSPPYAQNRMDGGDVKMDKPARKGYDYNAGGDGVHAQYGTTEGQLGAMRAGDVAAVIGSPPFTGCRGTGPEAEKLLRDNYATRSTQATSIEATEKQAERFTQTYGDSAGQLSAMPTGSVEAVVSSPPYADQDLGGDGQRKFAGSKTAEENKATKGGKGLHGTYGAAGGNLCNLPAGDVASCIISSPPFSEDHPRQAKLTSGWEGKGGDGFLKAQGFAKTEGNIAAMPPGDVADAIVSSPPFMSQSNRGAADPTFAHKFNGEQKYSDESPRDPRKTVGGDRNSDAVKEKREQRAREVANLGEIVVDSGATGLQHTETFWSAAKEIVDQCFKILRPGGIAIWVCKDFIRKGQRVPFSADWQKLCIACGFIPVEWIKASLVKETRHPSLFGDEDIITRTERKGFFRRLAEKKGSPKIDEEDVIIVRKPSGKA